MIAAAAERGESVSDAKLAKWRAAGLLPRPVQRSLGRARGTVTVYPEGSTAQLLRLLTIRAEPGRFDPERALWRLWWEGWPVDPAKVRDALGRTLQAWESALGEFGQALDAEDGDPLRAFETARLPPLLAKARKRTGAGAFSTVGRLVLDAAAGRFSGFGSVAAVGRDVSDDDDAAVMDKALGLAGVARAVGVGPSTVGGVIEETMAEYSEAAGVEALRAALEAADDRAVATARADLQAVLTATRAVWGLFAALDSGSNAGRDLRAWSADDAADSLPGLVLVVMALRRDPTLRPILDYARRWASVGGAV